MTAIERKLTDWIGKHVPMLLFLAAVFLGLYLRFTGRGYVSRDYTVFLAPWWRTISFKGFDGLAEQVGDYNISYQIVIWLFSRLPISPLHAYKLFSICFDFLLAGAAALIVTEVTPRKSLFLPSLCFALVFCSLSVVLNSAFWAQCDSVYTAFILLALFFTLKDRPIPAFLMLGLGFAFKLQTVFIFPFFLYYYFVRKKISILHFLLIPATDIAVCLPAVLAGRRFGDIFGIYLNQTKSYPNLYLNFPSFYALLTSDDTRYYYLHTLCIALTFLILGIGLALLLYRKADLANRETLLLTAVWTVFTCLLFLPAMHERYAYLLDVLAIIYVVSARKRYWLAVGCNLISLTGYVRYLFSYDPLPLRYTALLYVVLYFAVTAFWARDTIFPQKSAQTEEENPAPEIAP